MKKFEITREQVLKYNMQDEFPEAFKPTLEVGKWYKGVGSDMENALVYLNEFNSRNNYGFGCFSRGWVDEFEVSMVNKWTRATYEEVEIALTAEAIKRGVWDAPMVQATTRLIDEYGTFNEVFDIVNNVLWSRYGRVFEKGEWATALELTTEQRLDRIEKHLGIWKQ
jgi:hypothetical protein